MSLLLQQQAVLEHVERILASPSFLRAERMSAFLRFIIDSTLRGRAGELKETTIGVEVYGRAPGYDPKLDPIVRVDARRLRSKLKDYYAAQPETDGLRIELPTGAYIPEFIEHGAPDAPSSSPLASLAILPFANLSGDANDDYLVDGLTDELIHAVARDPRLRVVARTTAFQFRERTGNATVDEIGRRLRVPYVVEGAARREQTRLLLTVQLVSASSGYVLWSERYTLEEDSMFRAQEEIASAIGSLLRTLVSEPDLPAAATRAPRPEAHLLYLKGLYFWNKQTAEGLGKGLHFFQQAIDADQDYALARTGIAYAHVLMGNWGVAPPSMTYPVARQACEHALRLDPSLAEAHLGLGAIHCFYDWEWERAEERIERAIRLSPSNPQARHARALAYRLPLGDLEGAVAGMREAIDLDPLSLFLNADLASVLFFARRYEESLEQSARVLEMDPNYQLAHMCRGMALSQLNRWDEACAAFQRGLDIAMSGAWLAGWAGHCFARAGHTSGADDLRVMLDQARAEGRYVTPLDYASLDLGLHRIDSALAHLEAASEERTGLLCWAGVEPRFDELRGHPRFQRIVDRMRVYGARG